MKKLIIGLSLCAASTASMATAVCADKAGPGTKVKPAGLFVQTSFTPRCSANTYVDFQEVASVAAAGAASKKGNQVFGGHTNGGAVAVDATITCETSGCTSANAVSAADNALAAGSS